MAALGRWKAGRPPPQRRRHAAHRCCPNPGTHHKLDVGLQGAHAGGIREAWNGRRGAPVSRHACVVKVQRWLRRRRRRGGRPQEDGDAGHGIPGLPCPDGEIVHHALRAVTRGKAGLQDAEVVSLGEERVTWRCGRMVARQVQRRAAAHVSAVVPPEPHPCSRARPGRPGSTRLGRTRSWPWGCHHPRAGQLRRRSAH